MPRSEKASELLRGRVVLAVALLLGLPTIGVTKPIVQDSSNEARNISPWVGQTFTAEDPYIDIVGVYVVDFTFGGVVTDTTIEYALYRGVGTGGELLATRTYSGLSAGFTGYANVSFAGIPLDVGTTYTILVSNDSAEWGVASAFSEGGVYYTGGTALLPPDYSEGVPPRDLRFQVLPAGPTLTLDKAALRFGAVTTGTAFVAQTGTQVVRLTQGEAGAVSWVAVPNQPWLQVSPASGAGSADLAVSVVSTPGLPVGSAVTGSVTFVATGATAPPPLTVSLNLILNGLSASPFGAVDTPLENSTGVTGAVPFTGWALDDVGVTRVLVCRAAVVGELAPVDPNCGGAAQIFVGTAVFIDGARPDVAAFYPTYPAHTQAGWGFMVLTNMLPGQGNGTYLFFVHAQDADGHTTLLGTRTLTCANASATKPFGTIDTPTQGGVASGAAYVNFGWALTPPPKQIPLDGSTITVWVDGVPLGTVDYNHERSDVETLFPGYQNTLGSNGAVGFRVIDTTTLTNGLHTIAWTATDDAGAGEGIGSRFFAVSNGVGAAVSTELAVTAAPRNETTESMADAPLDNTAVVVRRGWDPDAPGVEVTPGRSGRTVIRSEEVSRIELRPAVPAEGWYTGYLRTGAGLMALPAGSQLDATTGVFTWAPGAGFVGAYDLVFVRWVGTPAVARREVRIVLAPKGSGAVGPQVVIDTPRSQQDVAQPFVLGGWAADLNAVTGTGIATVHVWAYPLAGGPPVFLGAASHGGARPDVAAVHGESFRNSGFGLVVQGLPHGHYDLAVFAWSTERAGFSQATVIRLTIR